MNWIKTGGDNPSKEGSFVKEAQKRRMSVAELGKKVLKEKSSKDQFIKGTEPYSEERQKANYEWKKFKNSKEGQKKIKMRQKAQMVKNMGVFEKGGMLKSGDKFPTGAKVSMPLPNKNIDIEPENLPFYNSVRGCIGKDDLRPYMETINFNTQKKGYCYGTNAHIMFQLKTNSKKEGNYGYSWKEKKFYDLPEDKESYASKFPNVIPIIPNDYSQYDTYPIDIQKLYWFSKRIQSGDELIDKDTLATFLYNSETDLTIGVNARFLATICKAILNLGENFAPQFWKGYIHIEPNTTHRPILISPNKKYSEKDNFFLVMPLKIDYYSAETLSPFGYSLTTNSLTDRMNETIFSSELMYKPRYEYLYDDLTKEEQEAMDIANEFGIYKDGGKVEATEDEEEEFYLDLEDTKQFEEYGFSKGEKKFYQKKAESKSEQVDLFNQGGDVEQIAKTIIEQLGGARRLQMFTGAYNFIALENGVSFRIKNRSINYIRITLNGKDLYDVEFGRIRKFELKVVSEVKDVYFDQLVPLFEEYTGMYLSFARGGKIDFEDPNLEAQYNRLSETNKAIVNLLQKYNPRFYVGERQQDLKLLDVDEQGFIRQWNEGINNKIKKDVVKSMWGLLMKYSRIKPEIVHNINEGAGKFIEQKPSTSEIWAWSIYGDDFETNDLTRMVNLTIAEELLGLHNPVGMTSGLIGVVPSDQLKNYVNKPNRLRPTHKKGSVMVLIAPLERGKAISGLKEVYENYLIKNAFDDGIDGQLIVKEI